MRGFNAVPCICSPCRSCRHGHPRMPAVYHVSVLRCGSVQYVVAHKIGRASSRFLILCLQCCALNTFRKQEITAEISKVDIQHQAIAASEQVQRWAVIVGIQQVGIDTLVGYGAAEEYRRRKRDLEEGCVMPTYSSSDASYSLLQVQKVPAEEEEEAQHSSHPCENESGGRRGKGRCQNGQPPACFPFHAHDQHRSSARW